MDKETQEIEQAFEDMGRILLSLVICAALLVGMLVVGVFLH